MDGELKFRISLVVFGGMLYAIRSCYTWLAGQSTGPVSHRLGQRQLLLISLAGLATMVGPALFIVAPRLVAWAALSLPQEVRWFGFGLGLVSDVLLLWIHRSLGRNYDMPGVIKGAQHVVTDGPYRWVRHPMYTTLFLAGLATFLITVNSLIGVIFLLYSLVVASMAGMEEATLMEKFGEPYRAYREQTGRLLPSIGRAQPPVV